MTPISAPRFPKQNTCSTAGCRASSSVRSAHVSITSPARVGDSAEKEEAWSLVKHTTSQRPTPATRGVSGPTGASSSGSQVSAKEGKRFSNTTTS